MSRALQYTRADSLVVRKYFRLCNDIVCFLFAMIHRAIVQKFQETHQAGEMIMNGKIRD